MNDSKLFPANFRKNQEKKKIKIKSKTIGL